MAALQDTKPENLPESIRHYIGGEWVDSIDGDTFDVLNPVTNEPYITAASGKKADIEAAVAAAKKAFEEGPWPKMLPRERSRILHKIADIVESRGDQLAAMESYDSGLPITQALGQARRAAENFRFFADLIVAQIDDAYKVPGRQVNYVNRKPIGVAGLITPWNTPFMLESWKLGPALATGNCVVLKPAEFTPLSASLWPGIFEEAGVPAGVFNLVNGFGEEGYAGDSLVKHPDVPLISFTGESRTGQIIFGNAAPYLKGLSMELGGKSPAVVFEDADLEAAINATVFGVFSLNGERCTAGSRILVQRGIYDEFVERYAAQAKRVKVGLPSDPSTEVGALVHPEHYEKVMSYVEIGKQEARLVAGGGRPEGFETGNYVAPTVFVDVKPDARIFQEEIFGPVVAITPFDTEEEALELANNTKYGLAAYIWTSDLKRAHNFAQNVEAGMVWLNSNNVRDLRTPFGGVKASGLGHEGGYRSIDFYTDQQAVHINLGEVHNPVFGKQEDAGKLAEALDKAEQRAKDAYSGQSTMGLIVSGGNMGYVVPKTGRTIGPLFEMVGLKPALETKGSDDHQGDDISVEAIAKAKPELLIVMDRDAALKSQKDSTPAAEVIEKSEALKDVPAVKNGNVVYLPADTYTNEGIQTYTEILNDLADKLERNGKS
ncbi:MAG TPA: 5-carboxymethyl-2-hydroxymuconate semialdehyde dehydrogenase [Kocuria sp.]|nr:5-carboxymethyl-2-hydroxymuconate semialdehyde dehydrogenase [Kocuria sp.]